MPETLGGNWEPCNLDEETLSSLEQEGCIASKAISRWRVDPGAIMPAPSDGEVVMLKSHIDRGLSLPPSYFLKGVLRHYRLQLHHIAPNSFTAIAGFVTLCEGIWVSTHAEIYSAYTLTSAITETRMEILAIADRSPLFLRAGNHTLILSCMILQRDGRDLSSIWLTRPLLKGSTACGLLLMVPPRSRIAGVSWTILPWMRNANYAHDGF
jgi:hypothetical protein